VTVHAAIRLRQRVAPDMDTEQALRWLEANAGTAVLLSKTTEDGAFKWMLEGPPGRLPVVLVTRPDTVDKRVHVVRTVARWAPWGSRTSWEVVPLARSNYRNDEALLLDRLAAETELEILRYQVNTAHLCSWHRSYDLGVCRPTRPLPPCPSNPVVLQPRSTFVNAEHLVACKQKLADKSSEAYASSRLHHRLAGLLTDILYSTPVDASLAEEAREVLANDPRFDPPLGDRPWPELVLDF
jgi:hypothetical protein